MNEQELNAIVEARLEAELAARHEADRQRVKIKLLIRSGAKPRGRTTPE